MRNDLIIQGIQNTVADKVLKDDLGEGVIPVGRQERREMRLDGGHHRAMHRGVAPQHRHPAGNRRKRCERHDQRQKQRLREQTVSRDDTPQKQGRAGKPDSQSAGKAGEQHLPMPAANRNLDQRCHMHLPAGTKPLLGNGLFNKHGHNSGIAHATPERQARQLCLIPYWHWKTSSLVIA